MEHLSQASQLKLTKGQINSVLQGYRDLKKKLHDSNEEIVLSQSPKTLTQYLNQNEQLFKNVLNTSTFAQDCQALKSITETAVTQSSAVNLGPRPFTFLNVRAKLQDKFQNGETFDWEAIGEWALRHSKTAPVTQPFLIGLEKFEPVRRERQPTQRRPKDVIAELQEVQDKDMSQVRANQLLARAKKLCEKLKNDGDLPLTQIIATKNGFYESVENAFELSHLVRDGRVGLHSENDKIVATANTQGIHKADRRKQCIIHLRGSDYQQLLQNISQGSQNSVHNS